MQENNNKALKRVVLLVVIVLPSVFYLLMTMGKHNFIYLPNVVFHEGEFKVDRNGKEFEDQFNYRIPFSVSSGNVLHSADKSTTDISGEVKLIQFYEKDSVGILDASLMFKAQTQLAEKLKHPGIELITFYRSPNAEQLFETIKSKTDKEFRNWSHVQISAFEFDQLKRQFFIEPVKEKEVEDSRLFFIMDENQQLRTGIDKQREDKYIFAYDAGREYSIKLLVEDVKLLLAEYQKELKTKKK